MIPRPRANLLLYHGAFAPRGCCRESTDPWPSEGIERRTPGSDAAVPSGEPEKEVAAGRVPSANPDGVAPAEARAPPVSAAYVRPRHFPWAELLRRTLVHSIDILACPDCGNRLRLLATIEDRRVIERILLHLGLPTDLPAAVPARPTPSLPGFLSRPEVSTDGEWLD